MLYFSLFKFVFFIFLLGKHFLFQNIVETNLCFANLTYLEERFCFDLEKEKHIVGSCLIGEIRLSKSAFKLKFLTLTFAK